VFVLLFVAGTIDRPALPNRISVYWLEIAKAGEMKNHRREVVII
jgi:hypothetical protein